MMFVEVMSILAYILAGFCVAEYIRFGDQFNQVSFSLYLLAFLFWPVAILIDLVFYLIDHPEPFRKVRWAIDFWICRTFLKREIDRSEFGVLYEAPSPYGRMRFVKVGDSTGTYWLTVPQDRETAKSAVAWTYEQKESEFNPERV